MPTFNICMHAFRIGYCARETTRPRKRGLDRNTLFRFIWNRFELASCSKGWPANQTNKFISLCFYFKVLQELRKWCHKSLSGIYLTTFVVLPGNVYAEEKNKGRVKFWIYWKLTSSWIFSLLTAEKPPPPLKAVRFLCTRACYYIITYGWALAKVNPTDNLTCRYLFSF